jgi:hypothetical protein
MDYPGAGSIPHSPSVRSFDDLVTMVLTQMDGPGSLPSELRSNTRGRYGGWFSRRRPAV